MGRPVLVFEQGELLPRTSRHPVAHDHAVLLFYTGGGVALEQRGQWTSRAGDVLLVPAGEPHRFAAAWQPAGWVLSFCPVCFIAEGAEGLLEPFERVRSGASAVMTIAAERRSFLEQLFRELRRELARPGPGTQAIQRGFITLMLAEVARATSSSPPGEAGDSLVTEALRFIERRCLEPISLRDVAEAVHRTPAYLTTAVRRATGRPVQAWIIAGRLSEARRRLLHTDELVDVIADRVGYADTTHFIRIFRRAHGVTPAVWRAQHRHSLERPAPTRLTAARRRRPSE